MPSKFTVIDGGKGASGGGGPEDPMLSERVDGLEKRVERVENRLASIEVLLSEIKGQLSQMPKGNDFATIRADVARVDGRLSQFPTTWQLLAMVISTWAAGAAIVFTVVRFAAR